MHRTLPFVLALAILAQPAPGHAAPAADLHERLAAQVASGWDEAFGAFAEKSGLPSAAAVELALLRAQGAEGDLWRERAIRTADFTWTMFDSVGGGFVHLPEHADPAHAGFEKHTDSNARRLGNLVDLMQAGAGEDTERRARQVIDYFERVLLDGRGGFMPGQSGDRFLVPDVNGLAIHAWLRWCAETGDVRRRNFAMKSLDRLWEHAWDDNFGLMRKGDFDMVIAPPQLIDQVEAGRAALLASQVVGRKGDRERSVRLGNLILANFGDAKSGAFMTRTVPDKKGGFKKAAVIPAENARAARFLCELSAATGDARYRAAAERAWEGLAEKISKETLGAADWALAVRESFAPATVARAEWPVEKAETPKPRSKRFR
jgi:uncharacterized protein YyaL (SSP411 family)